MEEGIIKIIKINNIIQKLKFKGDVNIKLNIEGLLEFIDYKMLVLKYVSILCNIF